MFERNKIKRAKMKRYFLYARKSTDTEDKQILSIQSQLTETRLLAEKENLTIIEEFREARTAKSPGRPIFNKMIELIEQGKADGIIAWHPDRLARNSIDGGKIIYLIDIGKIVDLRFPTYRFDNTAQGKFMLNIIFGQSKYYVDNLSENTKRGIREKLRRGEYPGFAPVGYLNDGKGKILIDKDSAPLIKKLFLLCAKGKYTLDELKKLATASGLVSKRFKRPLARSNIARILRNPFYYGAFSYKGEIYKGAHTPIINKELYDKAQEILEFKTKPVLNKNRYFALKGFMRCGECGCQITAETQKGHNYYHCTKRKGNCSQSQYLREEELLEQIKKEILNVHLEDGIFSQMMNELKREEKLFEADKIYSKRTVEIKIQEIENKLKKLLNLYLDGNISEEEYKEKKCQLVNKKIELETDPERSDGKWLEQMRDFLTLANRARYIALEANPCAQKDFFKKLGSNFKIFNASLSFSSTWPFKILKNPPQKNLG
jgi:DNA invertase Pin-like site-specific DNA recombinase